MPYCKQIHTHVHSYTLIDMQPIIFHCKQNCHSILRAKSKNWWDRFQIEDRNYIRTSLLVNVPSIWYLEVIRAYIKGYDTQVYLGLHLYKLFLIIPHLSKKVWKIEIKFKSFYLTLQLSTTNIEVVSIMDETTLTDLKFKLNIHKHFQFFTPLPSK